MCLCKGTKESTVESVYRGSLSNRSRISPVTLRSHDLKLTWLQRSWFSRIMSRQPLHIRHSRHSSAAWARKKKRTRRHACTNTTTLTQTHTPNTNTLTQKQHSRTHETVGSADQCSAQRTNPRGAFICNSAYESPSWIGPLLQETSR